MCMKWGADIEYNHLDEKLDDANKQYNSYIKHFPKKHTIMTIEDQIITKGKLSQISLNYHSAIVNNKHGANSAEKYRDKLKMKHFLKYQKN